MGADEEQVLGRVRNLMESGVIRRLGANFTSRKLGYTSTLCAARVPPEALERFVEVVNRYPGVTHNYLRRHHFNVWFTLIAESPERLEQILAEILRGLRGGDAEPAGRGNLQDQSRFSPLKTMTSGSQAPAWEPACLPSSCLAKLCCNISMLYAIPRRPQAELGVKLAFPSRSLGTRREGPLILILVLILPFTENRKRKTAFKKPPLIQVGL